MKRIREILKEVHLYTNKVEMLIKIIIWGISWIGGIYVLQGSTDKKSMGSAYFIFSLSLLMEFAIKIKDKKDIFSRIIHTLFSFIMIVILFMAAMILFGIELTQHCYDTMFGLTVVIMIFMFLDFFILWVDMEYVDGETNMQQENIKSVHKEVELFINYLHHGTLGNIEKGEQKDE